jgi:exonuclease III
MELVSSRIITARFKTGTRPVSIIQRCAPTETSTEEATDKFYALLNTTMTKIKRRYIIILMGDFNAKIRKDNKDIEQTVGRYSRGERNDSG